MADGRRARVRFERVAKPGGGSRSIATLAEGDAEAYERVVGDVVGCVEARLPGSVLAERVRGRGRAAWTRLEPWRPARARFRAAVRTLGADPGHVLLLTDVRECYGSMSPPVLERSLRSAGSGRLEVRAILRTLDRLQAAGVRGLPIGPAPSAVLANAVLCELDAAIRTHGLRHLRWVDDVVLAAPDRGIHAAMDLIATTLDGLRLRPNDAKTRIVRPGEPFVSMPSRLRSVPAAIIGPP